MRALSRDRGSCTFEMAANPILVRGVTHSGAGVLPGLPVLNVAGTSMGIRILAQGQRQQQTIPRGAGGSVSVQRVAAVHYRKSGSAQVQRHQPQVLLLAPGTKG